MFYTRNIILLGSTTKRISTPMYILQLAASRDGAGSMPSLQAVWRSSMKRRRGKKSSTWLMESCFFDEYSLVRKTEVMIFKRNHTPGKRPRVASRSHRVPSAAERIVAKAWLFETKNVIVIQCQILGAASDWPPTREHSTKRLLAE